MLAIDLRREERLKNSRRIFQVRDGFEERRDLRDGFASSPCRLNQHSQYVGCGVRHRDNDGAEKFASINFVRTPDELEQ